MRHAAPVLAILLAACVGETQGPAAAVPPTAAASNWRDVATEPDRERVRKWRNAWVKALEQAKADGHGAEVTAEGVLLDPDAALDNPAPPPGDYRCRTLKLGTRGGGSLAFVAYPFFACRIAASEGGTLEFAKITGSQRPVGRFYPDSRTRLVLLGTLQLGDEQGTLRYGHDRDRDMAGLVERIGDRRWRLVFPYPAFESTLDVIELQPKD
ncbi:MAG TPA: DUF4893 domain-containing protein [Allosphingosinicella sp.]|nr:DUF4893 domain-containing protein [Allosphingosinicella sp.]